MEESQVPAKATRPDSAQPRPRLWFVCPSFGGTSEVWMYRQAVGIERMTTQVVTFLRHNADRFPFPENALLQAPRAEARPAGVLSRAWWRVLNVHRGLTAMDPAKWHWWREQLAEQAPDIIFCQYGPMGIAMTQLIGRRIPVVTQFNGMDLSGLYQRLSYRLRLRRALSQMAGCVVVASYQRERLVSLGADPRRIRLIPYGAPLTEFSPGAPRDASRCTFLAVGRFVGKKAPLHTIRAFALCAAVAPASELRMIGDGELLGPCRELVKELGIADKVTFLGSLPTNEVRREMAAASVFVQHSVTSANGDMEGWPVAVAEACASGLPVVATRHAGIVDQVIDGQSGFLVAENDWQSMGDRMRELALNPTLRAAQAAASRRHIESFDVQQQVRQLENFLLECLSQDRPRESLTPS